MNYLSKRLNAARPHQDLIWYEGVNELDVVSVAGKRITLADGRELTEFVSCSYLGLDQRPELRRGAYSAIETFGVQLSAARTRIRPSLFRDLDDMLIAINHGWHPVTFASVSAAHLATIPVLLSGELPGYELATGGPTIVMDRSAHASLQALRGLMEQFSRVARVDFQDAGRLAETCRDLASSGRTVVAICDSVGSMGGIIDIPSLAALMDEVGGISYFDDAHGTSVFGAIGEGSVLASTGGDVPSRTIWTGSLSKAFGATGGFVALNGEAAASFLKRYAVPYAFGGPPSLPAIGSAVASAGLHLDGTVSELQSCLRENTALLDELLRGRAINSGSPSPIRGVLVGDEFAAIAAAKSMHDMGYAVTAAMYPTVELGQALVRAAVSASHTAADIRGLAAAANSLVDR